MSANTLLNSSPSWHYPLDSSHSCWNSSVYLFVFSTVRSYRRARAVSLALPLCLSGSRCSVITIWREVNWISACFISTFTIKLTMYPKHLYLFIIFTWKLWRKCRDVYWWEQENRKGSMQRWESLFFEWSKNIYIFIFPRHKVKYLLRRALFFSGNERLSVCMWILSGMSCPHVGIEMRAREAKVIQWWYRGSETYLYAWYINILLISTTYK